jgi:hypothetical protein
MGCVAKEGDLLALDDNKVYKVVKCIELNNTEYLAIIEKKISLSSALDIDTQEISFAEEVIDDNNNYFLKSIEDKSLISKLNKLI